MGEIRELVPIEERNGQQAVNARHLYAWLEIKKDFTDWMKAQIKRCDLLELTDYQAFPQKVDCKNGVGYTTRMEYALSIDAAKEISMMSQTEKGKQARRYFIECERIAKNPIGSLSRKQLALMVVEAEEEKERLMIENKKQSEELANKNKVIENQSKFVSFAKNAFDSDSEVDIGKAAKILQLGFGRNTLFKKLREDGVFMSDNEPKQKYIDAGYFRLTQLDPIDMGEGRPPLIVTKVLVRQKGLAFINLKYGKKNDIDLFKQTKVE